VGGVKSAWRAFVTAGMFVVRMLMLALMALLQLTLGGAEIRPASSDFTAAPGVARH
jgi:hypothetical protein